MWVNHQLLPSTSRAAMNTHSIYMLEGGGPVLLHPLHTALRYLAVTHEIIRSTYHINVKVISLSLFI